MGFLGILNKKKEESPGMAPMPDANIEDVNSSMSKDDSLPPLSEVPLPPKPNEESKQDMPNIPKPINMGDIEKPISAPTNITNNSSQDFNQNFNIPKEVEEPKSFEDKKPNLEPKQEEVDSEDFELPDFSEEELNMGNQLKDFEEDKEDEKEEAELSKEKENTELKSKLESKTKEEGLFSKEAKKEVKDDGSSIEPETKEEDKIDMDKNYFVSVHSCFKIFENLEQGHDIIKETDSNIQKDETKRRNSTQHYKTFHDHLDSAQEELMKIDSTLFER